MILCLFLFLEQWEEPFIGRRDSLEVNISVCETEYYYPLGYGYGTIFLRASFHEKNWRIPKIGESGM